MLSLVSLFNDISTIMGLIQAILVEKSDIYIKQIEGGIFHFLYKICLSFGTQSICCVLKMKKKGLSVVRNQCMY